MKIAVAIKPNSRHEKVMQIDPKNFVVHVNAPAREGRANERLVELLSDHFHVSRSSIQIVSGELSRKKIVVIEAR